MILINKKNKYNLKIMDAWFVNNLDEIKEEYDILYLFGYKECIKCCKNIKQYSLLLDITKGEDEIFECIRKNVKYEINRCNKENVSFEVYKSNDIVESQKILSDFECQYNEMYKEKNMNVKLSMREVNSYIENNAFVLTAAKFDEKVLCYHAYVCDNKSTRLLYSCSNFRSDDHDMKNLIARANKFLHWQDIKYFKQAGIHSYDFGGISSFEEPNGIDKFKMAFGGESVEYYNIKYVKTFKGKCYNIIRKILHK